MSAPSYPKCFPIESVPANSANPQGRFNRMVLVSHDRHLESLNAERGIDDQTVMVSSDWLLWQKCLARQMNCVNLESALIDPPVDESLRQDLLIRANDWVFLDGEDVTLFHGVSVGKQFNTEVALAIAAFTRLDHAIRNMVERYGVRELVYFDVRAETNILSDETRLEVVKDIARRYGLAFRDQSDPLSPNHPSLPMLPEANRAPQASRHRLVAMIAARTMVFLTRLFNGFRRKRAGVLLALPREMTLPLITQTAGKRLQPILWPDFAPKTPRLIARYLLEGIAFVPFADVELGAQEVAALDRMQDRLISDWRRCRGGRLAFARAYAEKEILRSGRFQRMAKSVKNVAVRFHAIKPRALVVDGIKNFPQRALMELAKSNGCTVHYIWHSPLASERFGYDALGCDPRVDRLVDSVFAWGEQEQTWLQTIGADVPCHRTGAPHLSACADDKAGRPGRPKRALILDYSVVASDLRALNATKYEFFVDTVRSLREMGFAEIRMKLHPGRPRKEYFDLISDYFGLQCPVYKNEPFEGLVDWADIVIGPLHSSAMMKVIGAGKEYYSCLLPPTWQDSSLYDRLRIIRGRGDLVRAISNREPTGTIEDLDFIVSWRSIKQPTNVMWQQLEASVSN